MRYLLACALVFYVGYAHAAPPITLALPPGSGPVNTVVRDAAGDLYAGGGLLITTGSGSGSGAFVAKLSSDGRTLIFFTALSTNNADGVAALAVAPDGSILAAGLTVGNFPVTQDADEKQPVGNPKPTGFFTRLSAAGAVVYSSYLNPSPSGQFGIAYLAMISDGAGSAYVTGQGLFDSTPGALPQVASDGNAYFTVKLNATGKRVWTTGGIGGSRIALDAQGSIYIAGAASSYPLPVTNGAFQSSVAFNACSGFEMVAFSCSYQYAAKLDPAGAQLQYATWLAGSYGASPGALLIDNEGNAILAGTTQSADYPVTSGALQTENFSTQPLPSAPAAGPGGPSFQVPYTGYVTKLNATGSALVSSTYLGGSVEDGISDVAIDTAGNFYLSGLATSSDFPGVTGVAEGCRPSFLYPRPFVTRLSADFSSLTETRLTYGLFSQFVSSTGNFYPVPFSGSLTGFLNAVSQSFCAVDPADGAPLTKIAPGQLITLFGDRIGEYTPVSGQPGNGVIPSSLADSSAVKIHGIAAPILYSSRNQINVQVPYEIAGQAAVKIEIDDPAGSIAGLQQFEVTPSQPSAFQNGSFVICDGPIIGEIAPFLTLARNSDGVVNSCANPAAVGSTITLYVNGLGSVVPGLATGAIATGPAVPLNVPITVSGEAQFVSAQSESGAVNGVWAVKLSLTSGGPFTLSIGGQLVRDPVAVWVR